MTTSYPIITLTTDFGHSEPYVGMMKGVILGRYPTARIVDLTHEIPHFSPLIAGFWVHRSLPYFPVGTIHVAVVDPGVGSSRRLVAASVAGQIVLAPDNGLVTPLVDAGAAVHFREVAQETLDAIGLPLSATFHGRDLFAPLAADLVSGSILFEQLGPTTDDVIKLDHVVPTVKDDQVHGEVIVTDRFGNLMTNLAGEFLGRWDECVVTFAGQEIPVGRTYSDVPVKSSLALVNAHGLVEIAVNRGRAADMFRTSGAKLVTIRRVG